MITTIIPRKCPSRSFPGVWELPLNQIVMEEFSCAMVIIIIMTMNVMMMVGKMMMMIIIIHKVDSCPPYFSEEELTEMFMENFRRHYNTNRAPLGLYFHTLWFKQAKNRQVV